MAATAPRVLSYLVLGRKREKGMRVKSEKKPCYQLLPFCLRSFLINCI